MNREDYLDHWSKQLELAKAKRAKETVVDAFGVCYDTSTNKTLSYTTHTDCYIGYINEKFEIAKHIEMTFLGQPNVRVLTSQVLYHIAQNVDIQVQTFKRHWLIEPYYDKKAIEITMIRRPQVECTILIDKDGYFLRLHNYKTGHQAYGQVGYEMLESQLTIGNLF